MVNSFKFYRILLKSHLFNETYLDRSDGPKLMLGMRYSKYWKEGGELGSGMPGRWRRSCAHCRAILGKAVSLLVGGWFFCASASVSGRKPAIPTGPGQSELGIQEGLGRYLREQPGSFPWGWFLKWALSMKRILIWSRTGRSLCILQEEASIQKSNMVTCGSLAENFKHSWCN